MEMCLDMGVLEYTHAKVLELEVVGYTGAELLSGEAEHVLSELLVVLEICSQAQRPVV